MSHEYDEPFLPAPIISTQLISHYHQVFIDDDITHPRNYRQIQSVLSLAMEGDTVDFIINSRGGRLSTAGALIQAMISTQAKTRAIIVGDCMSAATLLMLECDEIVVTDAARVMLHSVTFGAYGKSHDVKAQVDFISDTEAKMMRSAYAGFLTFEEMDEMLAGKEFWFDAEATIARIDQRVKFLAEINKEDSDQPAPTTDK